MTAFFESYEKNRDQLLRTVQLHSGWYTKRMAEVNQNSSSSLSRIFAMPLSKHGKSFSSFQDCLERTAGIINSPVYCLLNIPLAVLNIIVKVVDGICELADGEFNVSGMRFLSIVQDVAVIIAAPLLAVISLLGNLADVGLGVINTLTDSASSAPRIS